MSSWIKLFRDINKHWIWQNSDYLKWWLDILLEVNHAPAKVVIKNKIYDCNRGEKLYSLDTWAYRWGTNKSKARRFLQLLQNDNMIVLKSETQTTRLIVCKYDTYQDMRNGDETQMKRKRNASETHLTPIEEGKEEKEGKELFLLEKETKEENLSKANPLEIFPKSESVETGAEERKKVAQKKERFKPPTVQEVQEYCNERQNGIQAYTFVNFYQSKGWKVGNQPMKDWQAAVRTWEQKNKQNGITNTTQSGFSTSKPSTNNGNSGKRSYRQILAERLTNELKANGEGSNITIDAEICE